MMFFFGTHFKVLPFGDSYGSYGVLLNFLERGRLFIINPNPMPWSSPAQQFTLYSQWPGIFVLGMFLTELLGTCPFVVALVMPLAFFFSYLLFAYLIIKQLCKRMEGEKFLNSVATLLLIVMSWEFLPSFFYYFYLASPLFMIILYLLLRIYGMGQVLARGHAAFFLLMVLTTASLVITHHFTAILAVTFNALLLFALKSATDQKRPYGRWDIRMISAVALIILGIWLLYQCQLFLSSMVESFSTGIWQFLTPREFWTFYPKKIWPLWAEKLLQLRDYVLIALIGLGFLSMLKRSKVLRPWFMTVIFSSLLVSLVNVTVVATIPLRDLSSFLPFAAIAGALPVSYLTRHRSQIWKAVIVSLLALLVFSTSLGLWAHTYLPMHLYDSGNNFENVGEHPLGWKSVKDFLNDRVNYNALENILTDERYVAALSVPVKWWQKIYVIGEKGTTLPQTGLILIFRGFSTSIRNTYIAPMAPSAFYLDFDELEFKAGLLTDADKVYNNGFEFSIFYMKS
jgi:hypothetical protein